MSRFVDIRIEAAIVERATRGDRKAHEIIYRAFATPVYSLCLRFTRVPVHAEDLLQDTFIEIMRNIGQFRGEAPIGAWVRQVAVSKALMFLRSSWQRQGRSLDDDWEETTPGVQPARESHDEVIDLDAALARLPDTARAVVWLHDVEGFTHREIGQFMGKSESFSKSQLSRAYQRLRPFLRGAAAEGTPVAQSQPEGPGMGVRPVPAPDC